MKTSLKLIRGHIDNKPVANIFDDLVDLYQHEDVDRSTYGLGIDNCISILISTPDWQVEVIYDPNFSYETRQGIHLKDATINSVQDALESAFKDLFPKVFIHSVRGA